MKTLKSITIVLLVMLHVYVAPPVTHGQTLKVGVVAVYEGNESIKKLEWVRDRFDAAFEDQKNCLGLDYSLLPDLGMYKIDNALSADQAISKRLSDEYNVLKYVVVLAFPQDIDSSNPQVSIRVVDIEEAKSIVTLDPLIYDTRSDRFEEEHAHRYVSAGKQVVEELWCATESCEPNFQEFGLKDEYIKFVSVHPNEAEQLVVDYKTGNFRSVSKDVSKIDLKISLHSSNDSTHLGQIYPGEFTISGEKENIKSKKERRLIWDYKKDLSSCKIDVHGVHKGLYHGKPIVKLEALDTNSSFLKKNRWLVWGGAAAAGGGIWMLIQEPNPASNDFIDPPSPPTAGN